MRPRHQITDVFEYKEFTMSAAFQLIDTSHHLSEIAETQLEILGELLSAVDLGKRTEMMIDLRSLLIDSEDAPLKLGLIRQNLDEELLRLQQMLRLLDEIELNL
jgi:hypothetical protein